MQGDEGDDGDDDGGDDGVGDDCDVYDGDFDRGDGN